MVIYQKQHRLAHRQYCAPLSESRLTRFPPPSKKAFFPSSHIFRVNSKCIIKTLFSSKCSSINFRNSPHLKNRRDEKISVPERATEKVALLPGRRDDDDDDDGRERSWRGDPLSAGGCSQTWLRSRPAPSGPDPASTSRGTPRGAPALAATPRPGGGWGRQAVPLKDG